MPARRVRDAADFGRVAVLLGGDSAEREVSLSSGGEVLAGLRAGGVDAYPVDTAVEPWATLVDGSFDRAFVILHGRGGEDGTIQGALEVAGLPYTGTGVLGSALSMDKHRTKLIWQAAGVPTPDHRLVRCEAELARASEVLGFPLAVKPVHEGSSIGISKVEGSQAVAPAWALASRFDPEVMAEPWLAGPEYTVTLLDGRALPAIRLDPAREFYDYDAKYADGSGTRYLCPCGLEPEREAAIGELSLAAFESVGGYGWGRVDLVCDERGDPWFIDVNTAPGMTGHSLVPMAAAAAGVDFQELVWRVLETSLPR
jgi:D-alanine-D-alanine ligase